MKRYLVLAALLAVVCVVGCAKKSTQTGVAEQVSVKELGPPVEVDVPKSAFDIPYEPADVQASVAPYTVKPDLSNVVNVKEFGAFSPQQKALLAKNAFFAGSTQQAQLCFIYDDNTYKNLPSFITTDSVLQVYHIFYDFTLRNVETEKLSGVLQTLTKGMLKESRTLAGQMKQAEWKKAASDNQCYFAIPYTLLGKTPIVTPAQNQIVNKEIALIKAASGRTRSALFPWEPDYSQFIPRGHYTRTDLLKRYFKAMMWYGYMQFPVIWPMDGTDETGQTGKPDYPHIRQALLMNWMLFNTQIGGKPAIETWQQVYEPTAFYVGTSDDLTLYQYKAVMDKVYGPKVTLAQLQDEGKLKEAYAELRKLALPKINVRLFDVNTGKKMPYGVMFKFMGQRYIPDSEMMQRLVKYPERSFPKGLDVMAVLGSKRAADILDNVYKVPKDWSGYLPARDKLVKEFAAKPLSTWQSNLYWGWLWALGSFTEPFGKGYPLFMTNQAWEDKSLNTALGSWAELRHDTLLYAKQSGVECGGGGEEEPPRPRGYVEPNVEFYNRLIWLTKASKTGLSERGLLSSKVSDKFGEFEDLLTFLKTVSIKELKNQELTAAEYDQILYYGGSLESLTLSVMQDGITNWYEITNEADRDMAVVADVHTSGSDCLEEAVGHANELFVVVPIQGKLYITRGAVFSYYEFLHPSSDRLTDEKWQEMLKKKKAPPSPEWTKSFLHGVKREAPVPRLTRSTGC